MTIVTHTFNPSVDITYTVPDFHVGDVNRPTETIKNPGGKGINVSKVLAQLGADLHAYTYLGGANGRWIADQLECLDIPVSAVMIEGETRQCLAINDGQHQTEVLEKGPVISQEAQADYIAKLKAHAHPEVMTISGSSPQFEGATALEHLREVLSTAQAHYTILDTRADDLKSVLDSGLPINCIKPNEDEFEQLVGEHPDTEKKFYQLMKTHTLLKDVDVFLTLGARGAIIKLNNHIYRATVPTIQAVNAVGSGDSTVAGIAYGRTHFKQQPEQLIRHALACGMSNALQKETGKINIAQVEHFATQIQVEMV